MPNHLAARRLLVPASFLTFTAVPFLGRTAINAADRRTEAERTLDAHTAAIALLDGSITYMGGSETLEKIKRVRLDQIMQWLTVRFDDAVHADAPLYNWRSDLRDYAANARRVTLRVSAGFTSASTTWPEVVNVTNDSVAMQESADRRTVRPLHIVYIDEQREDFATSPDRLLLAMRSAPDARVGPDTMIAGQRHRTVVATVPNVSPRPLTLVVSAADSAPVMVRYRAAQPNDALLGPYGDMQVEIWWARWQRAAVAGTNGVTYPGQWDVNRVGRPYQRVTNMAMDFNVPATPDSFAISDSVRRAFLEGTTSKPMLAAVPIDSAAIVDGHFATLRRALSPVFGVLVGNRWVLLEGAASVDQRRQQVEWLERRSLGSRFGGGVVTIGSGLNGGTGVGTGWLVRRGVPVYVAPGARRAVAVIGENWGEHEHGTVPRAGRWVRLGGDSVWVEPVDLPRGPGSLLLYVPSLEWIYSGLAFTPAQTRFLASLAAKRGWKVTSIGSQIRARAPLPSGADQARAP